MSKSPLYRLNFISGNLQHFRLISFEEEPESLAELVKLAKKYCDIKNYRFVFIEPAITIVNSDGREAEVE